MGIHFKLLFPIVFVIAVIAGVMHFVWAPSMLAAERENTAESQHDILKALDSSLVSALLVGNYAAIYETLNYQMKSYPLHWKQVVLTKPDGKRVYPLLKPKIYEGEYIFKIEHDVSWDNEKVAMLTLYIDWESEYQDIHNRINQMEIWVLTVFTFTLMVAWAWQNYAIRKPLLQLREAADSLANGDFTGVLPVTGRDELGKMNDAFGNMREKLATAQRELEQALKATRESEIQKQTILDNMIGGLITTDKNGYIDSINLASMNIFGYSEMELVGQNICVLMSENDRSNKESLLKQYLQTGEARFRDNAPEGVARRKDGTEFPAEICITEMSINDEVRYCGIVRDLTERKRAEAERETAEHANELKTKFLSIMSHELRTPLNAVLGFAQLLELEVSGSDARDYVNNIVNSGNCLLRLIDQILDYARIEAGTIEMPIEAVELNSVIKDCLKNHKADIEKKRIHVDDGITNCNHYLLKVNELRFKQVMCNIFSNAVRYNVEEGNIWLDSHVVGEGRLRVSVADSGKGLTTEEMARLYVPFDRLDRVEAVSGSGIGLAIAERLLEKMDGKIGCSSQPGKGSIFWVEINIDMSKGLVSEANTGT